MRLLNNIINSFKEFDLWENSICICYRGSIAHGTYIPNNKPSSIDDKDILGVAIPPKEFFFSLKEFEQFEEKQDYWDVLVYDFKKFIRLLAKHNPNTIQLLWTPDHFFLKKNWVFEELRKNKDLFINKAIYKAFHYYAESQLDKMENPGYTGYMGEKRKKLVEQYGYDCKNAQHLIRLLRQGIEFLNTGELIVERPDREELINIKQGNWKIEKVKSLAIDLSNQLDEAYKKSTLPEEVDMNKVDELVQRILIQYYQVKL